MGKRFRLLVSYLLLVASVGQFFVFLPLANAQSSTSLGFKSVEKIPDAAIVSASDKSVDTAEIATPENRARLLGVKVSSSQSAVAIGDNASRVQVITSGIALVQVSNVSGDIAKGDQISVSPISGVGMKADSPGKIIGLAQADFKPGSSKSQKEIKLTKEGGGDRLVVVGTVSVQISVEDWVPSSKENSAALNNLKTFFANVTGKPVNNTQAVFCLAIIAVAILASAIILYSAVSSSIHSIGRNPLSKRIIHRSLFMMIGLAVVVLIGAGSAVYLILGG